MRKTLPARLPAGSPQSGGSHILPFGASTYPHPALHQVGPAGGGRVFQTSYGYSGAATTPQPTAVSHGYNGDPGQAHVPPKVVVAPSSASTALFLVAGKSESGSSATIPTGSSAAMPTGVSTPAGVETPAGYASPLVSRSTRGDLPLRWAPPAAPAGFETPVGPASPLLSRSVRAVVPPVVQTLGPTSPRVSRSSRGDLPVRRTSPPVPTGFETPGGIGSPLVSRSARGEPPARPPSPLASARGDARPASPLASARGGDGLPRATSPLLSARHMLPSTPAQVPRINLGRDMKGICMSPSPRSPELVTRHFASFQRSCSLQVPGSIPQAPYQSSADPWFRISELEAQMAENEAAVARVPVLCAEQLAVAIDSFTTLSATLEQRLEAVEACLSQGIAGVEACLSQGIADTTSSHQELSAICNEKFKGLDDQVNALAGRFSSCEQGLSILDSRFDSVDGLSGRLSEALEEELSARCDKRLQKISESIDGLSGRLSAHEGLSGRRDEQFKVLLDSVDALAAEQLNTALNENKAKERAALSGKMHGESWVAEQVGNDMKHLEIQDQLPPATEEPLEDPPIFLALHRTVAELAMKVQGEIGVRQQFAYDVTAQMKELKGCMEITERTGGSATGIASLCSDLADEVRARCYSDQEIVAIVAEQVAELRRWAAAELARPQAVAEEDAVAAVEHLRTDVEEMQKTLEEMQKTPASHASHDFAQTLKPDGSNANLEPSCHFGQPVELAGFKAELQSQMDRIDCGVRKSLTTLLDKINALEGKPRSVSPDDSSIVIGLYLESCKALSQAEQRKEIIRGPVPLPHVS